MASEAKLEQEIQRLYESSAVRDDLNDSEAQVLLQWGEEYLRQCAVETPNDEEFEQRSKYMRQLMKSINRFVGQREFMDSMREFEQLNKVMKWLPHTGLGEMNQAQAAINLPEDKSDMRANLDALLEMITPDTASQDTTTPDTTAQAIADDNDDAPSLNLHNPESQKSTHAPQSQEKRQQEPSDASQAVNRTLPIDDDFVWQKSQPSHSQTDTTYPSEQPSDDATDPTQSNKRPFSGDEPAT